MAKTLLCLQIDDMNKTEAFTAENYVFVDDMDELDIVYYSYRSQFPLSRASQTDKNSIPRCLEPPTPHLPQARSAVTPQISSSRSSVGQSSSSSTQE